MRAGRKGGKTDRCAFVHSMHHECAVGPARDLRVLDVRPSVGRRELGGWKILTPAKVQVEPLLRSLPK